MNLTLNELIAKHGLPSGTRHYPDTNDLIHADTNVVLHTTQKGFALHVNKIQIEFQEDDYQKYTPDPKAALIEFSCQVYRAQLKKAVE